MNVQKDYQALNSELVGALKVGVFTRDVYYEFVGCLCLLSKNTTDELLRLRVACNLWESAWQISRLLAYDADPNDHFEIKNMSFEEKKSLSDNLFLLCNYFTYNKAMNVGDFLID